MSKFSKFQNYGKKIFVSQNFHHMYIVDQNHDIWMLAARRAAIQFSDAAHQKIELRSGFAAAQINLIFCRCAIQFSDIERQFLKYF